MLRRWWRMSWWLSSHSLSFCILFVLLMMLSIANKVQCIVSGARCFLRCICLPSYAFLIRTRNRVTLRGRIFRLCLACALISMPMHVCLVLVSAYTHTHSLACSLTHTRVTKSSTVAFLSALEYTWDTRETQLERKLLNHVNMHTLCVRGHPHSSQLACFFLPFFRSQRWGEMK